MLWSLSLFGEKHFSLRRDRLSTHRKKKVSKNKGNIKIISSTTVAI